MRHGKKTALILAATVPLGIGIASFMNEAARADISAPLPPDTDLSTAVVTANASGQVYARTAQFNLTTSSSKSIVSPGSTITYSYKVTNVGSTDFKNVGIEDDKCANVTGPVGNVDADPNLNIGETWTYQCSTKVLQDVTHTAKVTATPVLPATTPTAPPSVSPSPTPSASASGSAPAVTNGTFTGSAVTVNVPGQGVTGTIQVAAVVSGGKLTGINVLQCPSSDATSKSICSFQVATKASNTDATAPTMIFEAITAGSANGVTVASTSGATYTGPAFKASLSNALQQAGLPG
jgi:uncharacterized protein with FMN-binding domain